MSDDEYTLDSPMLYYDKKNSYTYMINCISQEYDKNYMREGEMLIDKLKPQKYRFSRGLTETTS